MTHEEQRIWLINELQKEDNQLSNYPIPNDEQGQKDLLRALMNVWMPKNLSAEFLEIQDEYLLNMATALKKGELLPVNTISEYLKYHKDNLTSSDKKDFKTVFQKLKRMINF